MATISSDRYICLIYQGKVNSVLADPNYDVPGHTKNFCMVPCGGKSIAGAIGFNGEEKARKQLNLIKHMFMNELAICVLNDDQTFSVVS